MTDQEIKINQDKQNPILFQTRHAPFLLEMKRVLIMGMLLTLLNLVTHGIYITQFICVFVIIGLLDIVTVYLPARSRKYIVTEHSLIIKHMSTIKEYPFSEIGSISAAKGKILVVSMQGRVLKKINEIFIDPAMREEFKDILFKQMEKNNSQDIVTKYN